MNADSPRAATVAANLDLVRRRVEAAAVRAARAPDSVRLIGAVKSVTPERIREAVAAGLSDVAENFVQEAVRHQAALPDLAVTWHLIGHLQSNKARAAATCFAIIQSIDSLKLAEALSRQSTKRLPILLEVNVGREPAKFGFQPQDVSQAVSAIARLANLDVQGLMTVAPALPDPADLRPIFRELKALAVANGLRELSMGMSHDFEIAIEEGATMVRIGRSLFGERI